MRDAFRLVLFHKYHFFSQMSPRPFEEIELSARSFLTKAIYLTWPFMLPSICYNYSKQKFQYVIKVCYKISCVKPLLDQRDISGTCFLRLQSR